MLIITVNAELEIIHATPKPLMKKWYPTHMKHYSLKILSLTTRTKFPIIKCKFMHNSIRHKRVRCKLWSLNTDMEGRGGEGSEEMAKFCKLYALTSCHVFRIRQSCTPCKHRHHDRTTHSRRPPKAVVTTATRLLLFINFARSVIPQQLTK